MSRAILTAWLNEHRPELAARIANMPLELVRKVLNNETGLNIGPNEHIDESCVQYLAALQLAQAVLWPITAYVALSFWYEEPWQ